MLKPMPLLAAMIAFQLHAFEVLAVQAPKSQLEFRLADDTPTAGWQEKTVRDSDRPIFVSSDVALHGGHIEKACFHGDHDGNPSVGLTLSEEGAQAMEAITSGNHGKKIAILLDGEVVSAPTIRTTIKKEVHITGRFDKQDLLSFFYAIVLRDSPESDR